MASSLGDLRVSVGHTVEQVDARGRRFTAYATTSRVGNAEYAALRRFSDFVALHAALRADCAGAVPAVCPLRKLPPAMPAALRARVEALRVDELDGFLRRTVEACARCASPSASEPATGAGALAAVGAAAAARLGGGGGGGGGGSARGASGGEGARGPIAAAYLLASFLEIPADALLFNPPTAAGCGYGAGSVDCDDADGCCAVSGGVSLGAQRALDEAGRLPASPATLGEEAALRVLSDECIAASDGAAAHSKILWRAVCDAAARGGDEAARRAAAEVAANDYVSELVALLAQRTELLRSHLEATRTVALQAAAAAAAAAAAPPSPRPAAAALGARPTPTAVPTDVAQAAIDLAAAAADPPARLATALPSLARAAHAVGALARARHPPGHAAAGADAACPPTATPTAADATDAAPADDARAGGGELSAGAPAALVEWPRGPRSPPRSPPPRASREVAAALRGARAPSAQLVAAYADEIRGCTFLAAPGAQRQVARDEQGAGARARPGGGGEAEAGAGAAGGASGAMRDAAWQEADSASADSSNGDDGSQSGRGGSQRTRPGALVVTDGPAPAVTNWDDALASLPPLPPPPL
ncbi:hypothetical protein KFE25_004575 [Diacronema lutheri]|uniref:PX domain-containing protein n=1 Tax=Diacronema lutheri TaxID=2081491 RepID=A0A8J5X6D0_DIALT|nr:hypothetical protein KFE25_004575 [Diacronema lutheri]